MLHGAHYLPVVLLFPQPVVPFLGLTIAETIRKTYTPEYPGDQPDRLRRRWDKGLELIIGTLDAREMDLAEENIRIMNSIPA
jgi:hypothetical protein